MKLYFKGKLPEEKVAIDVVREFYKIYSPKKSCYIQGKEVEIKIINNFNFSWFINVLKDCEIEELHITPEGEETENVKKDDLKDTDKQVIDSKPKMRDSKSEACNINNEEAKDTEKLVKKNTKKVNSFKSKQVKDTKAVAKKIPEIEEIANQSVSFENFIENLATWLEITKRKENFKTVIEAATHTAKITQTNIAVILEKKGEHFGDTERIEYDKKVKNKFKEKMGAMKFIKIIASYKDFEFKDEEGTVGTEDSDVKYEEKVAEAEESEIEDGQKVAEVKESEIEDEEKTAEPKRIKMDCMPEIPAFEELLGSIDKTQPVEIRINVVLTQMGLNKLNFHEREIVVAITDMAMTMKEVTFTKIRRKCLNTRVSSISSEMIFSRFINNFVQQYEKEKLVKVEVFLKELQKIIVNEEEITN